MKTKISVYEIARWAAVLAALVLLISMFGGNTASSAEAADVAAAVVETIDMTNMVLAENQMIKRLYGLDPASFEGCVLYYPNTNMMAEEVLILKLQDTAQQDSVRAAIEARVETQKTTFDGYGVEQYALLTDNCIIEVRGNYVLFVVNAASAEAQKAFLGAI